MVFYSILIILCGWWWPLTMRILEFGNSALSKSSNDELARPLSAGALTWAV